MRRMIDSALRRCNRASHRARRSVAMKLQEDNAHSASRMLAELTHRFLAAVESPALGPFLGDWPQQLSMRPLRASTLPVLRWLPELADGAARNRAAHDGAAHDGAAANLGAALVLGLGRAAAALSWRQTYTGRDLDEVFLSNYGWTELFGLHGALVSERLACGFLLLGPQTLYPRHRHEAEEIYLPLSGVASWQQGDGVWREKLTGTAIHHACLEPHAMRTSEQPLLALYLWRGAGLTQASRLDD
jgi:dimethlysulfoniopropionate lyase